MPEATTASTGHVAAAPPDFAAVVLSDARPLPELVRADAEHCGVRYLLVPTIARYAGCLDPDEQPDAALEAAMQVLGAAAGERHAVLEALVRRHPRWERVLRRACAALDLLGGRELDLDVPPLIGPELADGLPRFELQDAFAAGSQGTVCLAIDRTAASDDAGACVVKFLRTTSDGEEPWLAEAASAARFRHWCAVRVLDCRRLGPRLGCVVYERARGRSLVAMAACEERPALDAVASALAELARGVAELHESGLAHGDISPSNVLLAPDGSLRLVDYGSLRPAGPDAVASDVRALARLLQWLSHGGALPDDTGGSPVGLAAWGRRQRRTPLPPRAFADALEHGQRRARALHACIGVAALGATIWLLCAAVT